MTKTLAIVLVLLGWHAGAGAQDWPARPVTLVVPFAAGGPIDVGGRILAQRLTEILGRQIVVENVGGAGGSTGASRVAKAPPDGYQVLLGNIATQAFSQSLHKKPPYDAVADFAPVGLTVEQPRLLVVRKDLAVSTLPEFIAYAKANAEKLKYGSAGAGSAAHVACMLLNSIIGVEITHVPYRATSLAMQDIAAGRVDYICDVISGALPLVQSQAVKPIAYLSLKRSSVLPQIATAHEQGLPDFDTSSWHAMFFPAGTPDAIVRRLNAALGETLDTATVRERLEALGATVVAAERRSPEYLASFLAREIEKWAGPIKSAGASTD
ncbi:MAG TPA: tripartite tricarboxylate transporter substrate-binding protein [Xanthobacteraceae bacterium]|nr:tripartite tricarboxylate transporter substrate-binding protein [Xanthobacteraceae bacterium]